MYRNKGIRFNTKINLYELCGAKQKAIKLGKELKLVEEYPKNMQDGHIAEIAFCAMMGILQEYYNSRDLYFNITVTKQLDKEGIDVKLNRLPVQIKSQYGTYPQIRDTFIHTLWLSYDNREFNIDNLRETLNRLGMPTDIPCNIITRMNHIWNAYMLHFNII
jgi:hypothetical protein